MQIRQPMLQVPRGGRPEWTEGCTARGIFAWHRLPVLVFPNTTPSAIAESMAEGIHRWGGKTNRADQLFLVSGSLAQCLSWRPAMIMRLRGLLPALRPTGRGESPGRGGIGLNLAGRLLYATPWWSVPAPCERPSLERFAVCGRGREAGSF